VIGHKAAKTKAVCLYNYRLYKKAHVSVEPRIKTGVDKLSFA